MSTPPTEKPTKKAAPAASPKHPDKAIPAPHEKPHKKAHATRKKQDTETRPDPAKVAKAYTIYTLLGDLWPEAHCELRYSNTFQLLVATVLSAQTTDRQVNIVTESLFQAYPTLDGFLSCSLEKLEEHIRSLGLYRNKAKNLYALARVLVTDYHGSVPRELNDLTSLPGVGRKTANVIRMEGFNIPALPVDTHVLRLANRLGLSQSKDPLAVEKDLTALLPDTCWKDAHHRLIWHGRRVCTAQKPHCQICPLTSSCSFYAIQPSSLPSAPTQK
ncbi:MAG: endonuclease III [Peptococcaceae bacterium]|nr:endonuclease III [Peptococcaceae bacterium]